MAAAVLILPPEQRRDLTSFYAFCRGVDDAADCDLPPTDRAAALDAWAEDLAGAYGGEQPRRPELIALAPAIRRHRVPRAWLELILEGVRTDLDKHRYATFDELYGYCFRVASAVGLVCARLLGFQGRAVEQYAEHLGLAMQLTNILRDVGEDAGNGRIYLPREDLLRFGVDEDDLLGGRRSRRFTELMRFEAVRAWDYYRMAIAALPRPERRRFYFAETLRETYETLLRKLEREAFPLLESRAALPGLTRLSIACKRRLAAAAAGWA